MKNHKADLLRLQWGRKEGAELRRQRKIHGLSPSYCAQKCGRSRASWNNWERGAVGPEPLQLRVIETELMPDLGAGFFHTLHTVSLHRPMPRTEKNQGSIEEDLRTLRDMIDRILERHSFSEEYKQ